MKFLTSSSGALLLAIAGCLFLVNWTSPAELILPHDPVCALPVRLLFWIVGGLALAGALFCLLDDQPTRQMLLVAWLATNFLVYQVGAGFLGVHSLAGYLGGFTRTFGISAQAASILAILAVGYLLAGSYGSLLWWWRCRKLDENYFKMSCPACGTHIKFARENLGQDRPCPKCGAGVTLRRPENLKMPCFFCKAHIEFPAHAIGQKIRCPHCQQDITLQQPSVTI
jgi:hypothetical protein